MTRSRTSLTPAATVLKTNRARRRRTHHPLVTRRMRLDESDKRYHRLRPGRLDRRPFAQLRRKRHGARGRGDRRDRRCAAPSMAVGDTTWVPANLPHRFINASATQPHAHLLDLRLGRCHPHAWSPPATPDRSTPNTATHRNDREPPSEAKMRRATWPISAKHVDMVAKALGDGLQQSPHRDGTGPEGGNDLRLHRPRHRLVRTPRRHHRTPDADKGSAYKSHALPATFSPCAHPLHPNRPDMPPNQWQRRALHPDVPARMAYAVRYLRQPTEATPCHNGSTPATQSDPTQPSTRHSLPQLHPLRCCYDLDALNVDPTWGETGLFKVDLSPSTALLGAARTGRWIRACTCSLAVAIEKWASNIASQCASAGAASAMSLSCSEMSPASNAARAPGAPVSRASPAIRAPGPYSGIHPP